MATVWTKWDGVRLIGAKDSQVADVTYIVMDVASEVDAIQAALVEAAASYNNIPVTDLSTADRLSERSWLVNVKFSTKLSDQPKQSKETSATEEPVEGVNYEIEFSAQAGTVHLTQSIRTKQVILITEKVGEPPNDAVPTEVDFDRNINDTGDEVQGIDFPPEAQMEWSETHFLRKESVNDEYVRTLEEMCGMVNEQEFRLRPPGCVLFRGIAGKRKDTKSYAFTFKFESRRPLINATKGGFTGINADGYDVLWVRRIPVKAANGKRIIQKAVQMNVEEVAVRGDFRELGIGVKGLDP